MDNIFPKNGIQISFAETEIRLDGMIFRPSGKSVRAWGKLVFAFANISKMR